MDGVEIIAAERASGEGEPMHDYHEGRPVARRAAHGGTLILCPYGHLLDNVEEGRWPFSVWSVRVTDPTFTVRCYGAPPQEARPCPAT